MTSELQQRSPGDPSCPSCPSCPIDTSIAGQYDKLLVRGARLLIKDQIQYRHIFVTTGHLLPKFHRTCTRSHNKEKP